PQRPSEPRQALSGTFAAPGSPGLVVGRDEGVVAGGRALRAEEARPWLGALVVRLQNALVLVDEEGGGRCLRPGGPRVGDEASFGGGFVDGSLGVGRESA